MLQDGDVAIGSLALTCRCFNSIVSMESFRREAHFQWLDSKFISVTVWLITALSQFFLSYVWFNMFKTMMRSADIFFFFRCRELEGIQWKFQKPVQGSIQSIQIVRLHTKTVMKATEEEGKEVWCRGSLALMTSKDTAEATVSMRLEEASNVSCNVFLMFELATFIAYFILLDSLFLLLH